MSKRALGFSALYTDAEGEQIQNGFVPAEMEDKWFIYFQDGWLYFHRSWTGACIYWLKMDGSPMGVRISESWVNAESTQYKGEDDEFDRKLVQFLIDAFLLGKKVEFPRPGAIPEPLPGVLQHHFVGRGFPETEYRPNVSAWVRAMRRFWKRK